MKRFNLAIVLLLSGIIVSCSQVVYTVKMSMRKPGERLVLHPAKAFKKYGCADRRPFLKLINYEVLPPEVAPGEEVNQHVEYLFCPERPSQVEAGILRRRIYYKGEVTFEDIDAGFELKPGVWALDAFIKVPENAPEGVYYLEVRFKSRSRRLSFRRGQDFVVQKKKIFGLP